MGFNLPGTSLCCNHSASEVADNPAATPWITIIVMGFVMKNLSVFALAANDHLVQPEEFSDVQANTSALAILTDFRSHKPHMVDSHLEATEALEVMLAEDVKTKIVVDDSKEFIGVISVDDLADHNMLLKQMALHAKRDELLVRDLMHPRAEIRAIDFEQFITCSVGDVVSTLKKSHQEYLLVVDKEATAKRSRPAGSAKKSGSKNHHGSKGAPDRGAKRHQVY